MKCTCDNCGWRGTWATLLKAANPFDDETTIDGCPQCKAVEQFTNACQNPACWNDATCGTPTPSGYQFLCSKHYLETTAISAGARS